MSIRLPAEWEKQKSIMVVFPTTHKDWQYSIDEIQLSYVNFINAIRKFQKCIIICDTPEILNNFFNSYKNIEIKNIKTDDTWIRDFGAIDIFIDGKLKSYNFIFNAWGNKFESTLDNNFNSSFFQNNLINIDFILEGGSIDSNGDGVMLTTKRCIFNKNRNSTCKDIKSKIKNIFGLKELIVLEHGALIGDDTDSHIDTLARFISKDTIVYTKCYDESDTHFKELDMMEKELQQTSFKLIPLPLPSPRYFNNQRLPATYINFVFINNALILPSYNDKNNKKVIEILKKVITNRRIVTVEASIFIREYGSLHCSCISQMLQL